MRASAVLLCLAFLPAQVDKISLQFYQDSVIIREGLQKEAVPLQLPKIKPPLSVLFRKNKTFLVWDDRGLTVRIGKKVFSTHLPEIAVSPRVFAREEILKTLDLIRRGKRWKNANALSGSRRIGNTVYFLIRWDDSDHRPWLEAVVSVDLADPAARPMLIAKMAGHSLATEPIEDQLVVMDEKLVAITTKGDDWGIATFDPVLKLFVFNPIGQKLKSYVPLTSKTGAFVEGTEYGTFIAGRVDLPSRSRKTLFESKGSVKFFDSKNPLLVVSTHGDSVILNNTETGAEVSLPTSSAIRRTSRGIIVWSPFKDPKHAWLYDPERWDVVAEGE